MIQLTYIEKMKSVSNKIQVLLVKYIENKTTNEESLVVLKALSSSSELRWIFCMAVAGMAELQRPYNCYLKKANF